MDVYISGRRIWYIKLKDKYGCGTVQITASDMGMTLYSNFGFEKAKDIYDLSKHNNILNLLSEKYKLR